MAKKKVAKRARSTKSKVKSVKRVKRAVKRPAKGGKAKFKKAAVKKSPVENLEKIGEVTHYFPHVNAAAVKILKGPVKVGEEVYVKGHTTDFKEKIESMQLDHAPISEGKKGDEIGLMVKSRVRIGDSVYRI